MATSHIGLDVTVALHDGASHAGTITDIDPQRNVLTLRTVSNSSSKSDGGGGALLPIDRARIRAITVVKHKAPQDAHATAPTPTPMAPDARRLPAPAQHQRNNASANANAKTATTKSAANKKKQRDNNGSKTAHTSNGIANANANPNPNANPNANANANGSGPSSDPSSSSSSSSTAPLSDDFDFEASARSFDKARIWQEIRANDRSDPAALLVSHNRLPNSNNHGSTGSTGSTGTGNGTTGNMMMRKLRPDENVLSATEAEDSVRDVVAHHAPKAKAVKQGAQQTSTSALAPASETKHKSTPAPTSTSTSTPTSQSKHESTSTSTPTSTFPPRHDLVASLQRENLLLKRRIEELEAMLRSQSSSRDARQSSLLLEATPSLSEPPAPILPTLLPKTSRHAAAAAAATPTLPQPVKVQRLSPTTHAGAPSPHIVPTKELSRTIDGTHTDIVVQDFVDRTFVLVTQVGRIGSVIQASLPSETPYIPFSSSSDPFFHDGETQPDAADPTSSSSALSLPPTNPSLVQTPLFGTPPQGHEAISALYVSTIWSLLRERSPQQRGAAEADEEEQRDLRPVVVALGLRLVPHASSASGAGVDDGGWEGSADELAEGERQRFAGVVRLLEECLR